LFTVIRAPFDGVVGNRAVQSGDYVQPGQRERTRVSVAVASAVTAVRAYFLRKASRETIWAPPLS
jgi:multidrug resistance efflux pump